MSRTIFFSKYSFFFFLILLFLLFGRRNQTTTKIIPPGMERELRLKAFMEEYARIVQLFDDIVSMKESMGRLEKYMIIMVCQVLVALMVSN
ncbi:hypothetical protein B9Z55_005307 [Caenorhabditis nigoni]|uniref:Uncharacterized protein n=1 Tax=Caenorhabditis nigoni TaxID=1611254 RepID=A0A2G5V097_9PELO|nr:hypothetical protein B9Z55_005307 [Caenorhabditis nigoni]